MSANVAKVAKARARMWSDTLAQVLAQPRGPQQQQNLANLLAEAQQAFGDLLEAIQLYSEGLQDAAIKINRDGLPIPPVCRDANALASVARTLLSHVESP